MSVSPVSMYAELLSDASPGGVMLRHDDGRVTPLEVERWLAPTCPVDEAIADAAVGPVLDVGCGPGRLLDALARHGKWALGVDLSPTAVALARGRGRRALAASVFDDLPGVGDWGCALLLDGSVGIGGDIGALLDRVSGPSSSRARPPSSRWSRPATAPAPARCDSSTTAPSAPGSTGRTSTPTASTPSPKFAKSGR